MKRLLVAVCFLFSSLLSADAGIDVAKAKASLIMVDGVFYVASKTTGKILIGGQWVDPTGSRAFYANGTAPTTQAEWDQLWADMAVGGAGVSDFLASHIWEIYADGRLSEMVGLLGASGLADSVKARLYSSTFFDYVSGEMNWGSDPLTGGVLVSSNTPGVYDYSGWDLNGVDLMGWYRDFWGISENVDFSGFGFTKDQLVSAGSGISGALLHDMDLSGVIFNGTSVPNRVRLVDCNLSNADLRNLPNDFCVSGSNLSGANLSGMDLSSVFSGYSYSSGQPTSFAGADLRGSSGQVGLCQDWVDGVQFTDMNFTGAKLYGSTLMGYDSNWAWVRLTPENTPSADWNP